jgi:hypothetical protein
LIKIFVFSNGFIKKLSKKNKNYQISYTLLTTTEKVKRQYPKRKNL